MALLHLIASAFLLTTAVLSQDSLHDMVLGERRKGDQRVFWYYQGRDGDKMRTHSRPSICRDFVCEITQVKMHLVRSKPNASIEYVTGPEPGTLGTGTIFVQMYAVVSEIPRKNKTHDLVENERLEAQRFVYKTKTSSSERDLLASDNVAKIIGGKGSEKIALEIMSEHGRE